MLASAFDPAAPGFALTLETESSGLVASVTGRIESVDALIVLFMRIGAELSRTGLRQGAHAEHGIPPGIAREEIGFDLERAPRRPDIGKSRQQQP